jgi:hypothetical protein
MFLVGDQALELRTDTNSAGLAEAFHFTAAAGGALGRLSFYIDSTSRASRAVVGIYSGTATHPTTLLAQAVISSLVAGAWNTATIAPVNVVSGAHYWIAVLGPAGTSTLSIRDRCCGGVGGGSTETSKSTSLASLPVTWVTGSRYNDGPFSAYGSTSGS